MGEKIEIDIDVLSEAVSNIDGGCHLCIGGFLDNLPLDIANKIAPKVDRRLRHVPGVGWKFEWD